MKAKLLPRCPVITLAIFPWISAAASKAISEAIATTPAQEQIVANDITPGRFAAFLRPVKVFYVFWVTGSSALHASAVGPDFVDDILPSGSSLRSYRASGGL